MGVHGLTEYKRLLTPLSLIKSLMLLTKYIITKKDV